ncbi:MAG: hypothetical protein RJA44_2237 [Pseudomonadota bacterium]|jgi:c-di-GMP-binding flagellar brake protein YcgR
MLDSFWNKLKSKLVTAPEPQPNAMFESVADLFITDALKVRQLLEELQQSRVSLAAQSVEGEFIGRVTLYGIKGNELTARVDLHDPNAQPPGHMLLNLVGSTGYGVLMFTLALDYLDLNDLWRARVPHKVMRVQSRRHRRVTTIQTIHHHASLQLSQMLQKARLIDLSEEGAGLKVSEPVTPEELVGVDGELVIDGDPIYIPAVSLAHLHGDPLTGWHVGLSLHGIEPSDQRCLARWLNEAETSARLSEDDS